MRIHAVIDAFEALRRKHAFAPEDIETCTCLIPPGALPVVSEPANSKLNPPPLATLPSSVFRTPWRR